jgi:hypothetical protein
MDKINIPINEIIEIINFGDSIPKTTAQLVQTICALDSTYYKKIDELLYLNLYRLKEIIYTILEIKYPTKSPNTYKDIVFTEEMIYY